MWHSGLRIQCGHCSNPGHCCDADSVHGRGTSTCHGYGKRKKERQTDRQTEGKQARKKASKQARENEKASKQDRQTCEKLFVFVENLSNGVRIPKGKVQQGKASIVPFEKF